MKRRDERTRAALVSLAACAACVGGASQAEAAGFALSEQGAGAAGVGGAATARSDLLEAGFYNPAGGTHRFEGDADFRDIPRELEASAHDSAHVQLGC